MSNKSQIKFLALIIVSVFAFGAVSVCTDDAYATEGDPTELGTKEALLVDLQNAFNNTEGLTDVAEATINQDSTIVGDNITVNFKTNDLDDLFAGAVALGQALIDVVGNGGEGSTLIVNDSDPFELNNIQNEMGRLAEALLTGEDISDSKVEATYEANVRYGGADISLAGSVTFQLSNTKEALLVDLQNAFNNTEGLTDVAEATINQDSTIVEDNITVNFKTNDLDDLFAGAVALGQALIDVVGNGGEGSTLIVNDSDPFELNNIQNEMGRLAEALLTGEDISDSKVEATYEANVRYGGADISLAGSVTFQLSNTKEALLVDLQNAFNNTEGLTDVAEATINQDSTIVGDNITVNFKTNDLDDLFAGAVALGQALIDVVGNGGEGSTLIVNDSDPFELNNIQNEMGRLAEALLTGEDISDSKVEATYEANVRYGGADISLAGSVTFQLSNTKEALLVDLQNAFNNTEGLTDVAEATINQDSTIVEDNITVNFKTNDLDDLFAGAVALGQALIDVVGNGGEGSTLIVNDSDPFELNNIQNEMGRLAEALLTGEDISDSKVEATYEANVRYGGADISLAGSVTFQLSNTKEALLVDLQNAFNNTEGLTDVAEATINQDSTIVEDNITVNFKTNDLDDLFAGAVALGQALIDVVGNGGEGSTLIVNDSDPFELNNIQNEMGRLAEALLTGEDISDSKVEATYEANVRYGGADISLAGSVTFQLSNTKEALLVDLQNAFNNTEGLTDVAEATINQDSTIVEDNITVNFKTNDLDDLFAGAVALGQALIDVVGNGGEGSTLIVNDSDPFELNNIQNEMGRLAEALLTGEDISDSKVEATYEANVRYGGADISLAGSVTFQLSNTKEALLVDLQNAFNNTEGLTDVAEATINQDSTIVGDNITVNFKTNDLDDLFAGAVALGQALIDVVGNGGEGSTLIVNDSDPFELNNIQNEMGRLAEALLTGEDISDSKVEATYEANVRYGGADISLAGSVTFQLSNTKEALLVDLQNAFNNTEGLTDVAEATINQDSTIVGDNITVNFKTNDLDDLFAGAVALGQALIDVVGNGGEGSTLIVNDSDPFELNNIQNEMGRLAEALLTGEDISDSKVEATYEANVRYGGADISLAGSVTFQLSNTKEALLVDLQNAFNNTEGLTDVAEATINQDSTIVEDNITVNFKTNDLDDLFAGAVALGQALIDVVGNGGEGSTLIVNDSDPFELNNIQNEMGRLAEALLTGEDISDSKVEATYEANVRYGGADISLAGSVTFNLPYTIEWIVDNEVSETTTVEYGTDNVTEALDVTDVEGHTFSGWYTDVEMNTEAAFPATVTEDTKYYAVWTINKYTATLDLAGGSFDGEVEGWTFDETTGYTKEFDYEATITLPGTDNLTKEGYVFDAWTADHTTTMPAEDITILATWKLILTDVDIVITVGDDPVYDGSGKTLTVELADGTVLTENYTVTFGGDAVESYKNAGTYTVTVTLDESYDNYTGTATATFEITKADLPKVTVSEDAVYDGTSKTPTITIEGLTVDEDYTVSGIEGVEFINAGTYTVTVTGKGNYKGSVNAEFIINTATPNADNVILPTDLVYDGLPKTVAVKLDDGTVLTGTDYTVYFNGSSTSDFTKAGIYTVTILSVGSSTNYVIDCNIMKTFTIASQTLVAETVTVSEDAVYDGTSKTPTITIEGLTVDVDYTVSGLDVEFIDAGTYTVTVTGEGNYEGTVTVEFTIASQTLVAETVTVSEDAVYDGTSKTPTITIEGLTVDEDYTVSGLDVEFIDAGTYTVTVTGEGNYEGTVTVEFTIASQTLVAETVTVSEDAVYDGTSKTPTITIEGLTVDEDYTVSGIEGVEFIDAGTYTVTVTGEGNYEGTVTVEFTIASQTLVAETVTVSEDAVYDGTSKTPTITIEGLTVDEDYTVSIEPTEVVNAGTYTVTVTGEGNYEGTVTVEFTIASQTLVAENIDVNNDNAVFNRTVQNPVLTIGTTTLEEGADYTIDGTYGFKDAKTYTFNVTGTGNYTGSVTVQYTIGQADLTDETVTVSEDAVYDGTSKTPTITIEGLTVDEDYTVSGIEGVEFIDAGTYTVTVTGKGNYKGSVNAEFIINTATPNADNVILPTDLVYDGLPKTVAVKLDDGTVLTGTDYTVYFNGSSTSDFTKAGIYTVTILSVGSSTNYVIDCNIMKTFTIASQTLVAETVTVSEDAVYDGTSKTPTITIEGLTVDVDYTVSGLDVEFIDAGTYTVTVTGEGNYEGTVTVEFTIASQTLVAETVTVSEDAVYDGTSKTPTITIEGLTVDEDYTVSGLDVEFIDAGTYTVTVTGEGNYEGTVTVEFTIASQTLVAETVTVSEDAVYDGTSKTPTITIEGLTVDEDYTVSGIEGVEFIDAGTYTVTVTGEGNYEGTVTVEFTIASQTLVAETVTVSEDAVYDGTSKTPTITIEGLTVDEDYTVSIEPTEVVNAGTYTVTVTGKGNYKGSVNAEFIINTATPNADNVILPTDLVYDGLPKTVAVKLDDGTVLTGTDYTVYFNGSSTSDFTKAGIYTVTILSVGSSTNYVIDCNIMKTFTIASQTLVAETVTVSEDAVYDGTSKTPTITIEGLTVDVDYTVSGLDVEFIDAGTYTVTVTGEGNYTGSATGTFEITAKEVLVTPDGLSKVYDGTDPVLTYNLSETIDVTGTLSRVAGEDVGAYDITMGSMEPVSANYVLSMVDPAVKFTITVKTITVTPDGLSKVYDGTDPVLTYNLSETIDVTGTLSRVAGEDVGAYDITMGSMEPVSANYVLSMVDPAVKFTITVKTITVTPDGLSKVYDGTDPVLTYNLSETIDVTGTLSRVAGEDVGAYDITMGSMEPVSANYVLSMVDPAVKFTITVKTITVTPDGLSKVYDGTDPVLTYNLSETIDVTGTLSRVAGEDVGAYDITMGSMEPVSANYVLSMVDPAVKFTITVKTITVTPDGLSKVYDGTDPVLTYNLSETIDVTGTLSRVAGEDVGAYDITMGSMEPVSANYVLSMVDPAVKFTITVKTITVTPDGLSKVYDGTDPVLTYNLSETIDVTGTLSRVAGEDVGAYDITMGSMEPVSANYVLSMVDPAVKFTITVKTITVTPDGLSKVYDGTDPVLTYNLSETIDVTGTLSRVAGEDVGAYDITMGSMEPVSANYVLSMVDPAVKFTITVKTITVTPDGLSKVYDGTDPVLTYNLSETIDVTGTLSRVAGEDVGAYDITMGSMEPVSANYVLSMVDPAVKFTITVKTITVTPDGLSKVYDGTDPVLTYNLSETIDVTGTLSRVAGEDVGAYDITMGSMEPVSANYVLSMVDPAVKFTITVKTITVTPDGLSKVYDGTDPVLTYNLSETIDVTGTLSRVAGEDVGAYDITMGSMEPVSANYVLSMVDPAVKFTITVKTITVTPDGLSKVYDGTDPVLTYNLSETIDVTGTLSRVAGEDVGAYDITMGSMEPVSANYVLSMVDPAVKFTITVKTITVTPDGLSKVYDGTDPVLTYNLSETIDVTGTLSRVAGEDVGAYDITMGSMEPVSANYVLSMVDPAVKFTITVKTITVTPDGLSKVYDGTDPVLTYNLSETIDVTGTLSRVAGEDVGAYDITMGSMEPVSANYVLSMVDPAVKFTITVKTITVTPDGLSKVYDGTDPVLTYNLSETIDVTGTLSRVAGEDVGAYDITMGSMEPVSANYVLSMVDPAVKFTITVKTITVTPDGLSKVYDGTDPVLTYNLSETIDVTGTLSRVAGEDVGAYDITMGSMEPVSANYVLSMVDPAVKFTITVKTITVTPDGLSKVYDGTDPVLTYNLSETIDVTGTLSRVAGEDVGAYDITMGSMEPVSANYVLSMVDPAVKFTITVKTITVTPDGLSKVYDGTDPVLTYNLSETIDVTGTLSRVAGEDVGAYDITMGSMEPVSANYVLSMVDPAVKFTITVKTITVTPDGLSKVYDGTDPVLTYNLSETIDVTGTLSRVAGEDVGAYDITMGSMEPVSANYVLSMVDPAVKFTITVKTITVTPDGLSKVYDGTDPVLTYNLSETIDVTGTLSRVAGEDVGAYDITMGSMEPVSANYVLSMVDPAVKFTITVKTITVTPDGLSKVYDGTDPVLTYNLSETIDVTGTLSRVAGEDVGAYDITMGSMEPVSANYVLSMVDPAVKFTITVKTITVTPDGLSKVYDGTDPVLTYNLSETIDVTGTLSRVAGEDVGAYDITMGSMEPVSANYVLSMVDPAVKFTITVKTITVTPDGLSKVYDGTDPVLTYNLSETIDVTGTLSRVAGEDVGAYDITMGSMEPVSANYVLSMVDPAVKFTITVKTITVTPDGLSKVYDGTDPVLTYNLSETIDVTGTLSRVAGEDVGAYDITMGSMEPVSANYVLSMVDPAVKFTIKSVDEYLGGLIDKEDSPTVKISKDAAKDLTNVDFEKLTGKTLVIDVVEDGVTLYSWTFEGTYEESNTGTFNASILKVAEPDEALTNLLESKNVKNPLVLNFSAKGKLPMDPTIKYYVGGDFEEGAILTLFFYNEEGNGLDRIESDLIVDENGYVKFSPPHFSQYVLAEMDSESGGASSNTLLYVGVGIIVVIIAFIAVVALRRP